MGQLIGYEWHSVNGTKGVVISGTNQDQDRRHAKNLAENPVFVLKLKLFFGLVVLTL